MKRGITATASVGLFHLLFGAVIGNLAAVLPLLKRWHQFDDGTLGAILVGAVVGAIAALMIGSKINELIGSGVSLLCGSAFLVTSLPVLSVASNSAIVVTALFLFGLGSGWADVAMTNQAVVCERLADYNLLGMFHGIYAGGGLIGAFLGGFSLKMVSYQAELIYAAFSTLPVGAVSGYWLIYFKEESEVMRREKHEAHLQNSNSADCLTLAMLSILCGLSYAAEGAVQDWSAIYISESIGGNTLESVLGFVAFESVVAICACLGDRVVLLLGRRRLLQVSGVLGSSGLVLVVTARLVRVGLVPAVIGFALCGAGVSSIGPSTVAVASQGVKGCSVSDAIACVCIVGYIGYMVGPPLMGGISQATGCLCWSYAAVAGLLLLIPLIAHYLVISDANNGQQQVQKEASSEASRSTSDGGQHAFSRAHPSLPETTPLLVTRSAL